MDFLTFTNILLTQGVDVEISKARALFNQITPFLAPPTPVTNDYNLMQLRAKLTSTSVHDQLVAAANGSQNVREFIISDRKIHAIKELRDMTNCGLKEAKDAIEDSRVWGQWHY